jgi:hypothetical protein
LTAATERTKNNSAPSECSQDSETSSEFVKFGEEELASLPEADFLTEFGNRVATEALDKALEGNRVGAFC